MIQAKVHMSKYGGQPDTPSYIWVWSIVLSQGSKKKKVLIEKSFWYIIINNVFNEIVILLAP